MEPNNNFPINNNFVPLFSEQEWQAMNSMDLVFDPEQFDQIFAALAENDETAPPIPQVEYNATTQQEDISTTPTVSRSEGDGEVDKNALIQLHIKAVDSLRNKNYLKDVARLCKTISEQSSAAKEFFSLLTSHHEDGNADLNFLTHFLLKRNMNFASQAFDSTNESIKKKMRQVRDIIIDLLNCSDAQFTLDSWRNQGINLIAKIFTDPFQAYYNKGSKNIFGMSNNAYTEITFKVLENFCHDICKFLDVKSGSNVNIVNIVHHFTSQFITEFLDGNKISSSIDKFIRLLTKTQEKINGNISPSSKIKKKIATEWQEIIARMLNHLRSLHPTVSSTASSQAVPIRVEISKVALKKQPSQVDNTAISPIAPQKPVSVLAPRLLLELLQDMSSEELHKGLEGEKQLLKFYKKLVSNLDEISFLKKLELHSSLEPLQTPIDRELFSLIVSPHNDTNTELNYLTHFLVRASRAYRQKLNAGTSSKDPRVVTDHRIYQRLMDLLHYSDAQFHLESWKKIGVGLLVDRFCDPIQAYYKEKRNIFDIGNLGYSQITFKVCKRFCEDISKFIEMNTSHLADSYIDHFTPEFIPQFLDHTRISPSITEFVDLLTKTQKTMENALPILSQAKRDKILQTKEIIDAMVSHLTSSNNLEAPSIAITQKEYIPATLPEQIEQPQGSVLSEMSSSQDISEIVRSDHSIEERYLTGKAWIKTHYKECVDRFLTNLNDEKIHKNLRALLVFAGGRRLFDLDYAKKSDNTLDHEWIYTLLYPYISFYNAYSGSKKEDALAVITDVIHTFGIKISQEVRDCLSAQYLIDDDLLNAMMTTENDSPSQDHPLDLNSTSHLAALRDVLYSYSVNAIKVKSTDLANCFKDGEQEQAVQKPAIFLFSDSERIFVYKLTVSQSPTTHMLENITGDSTLVDTLMREKLFDISSRDPGSFSAQEIEQIVEYAKRSQELIIFSPVTLHQHRSDSAVESGENSSDDKEASPQRVIEQKKQDKEEKHEMKPHARLDLSLTHGSATKKESSRRQVVPTGGGRFSLLQKDAIGSLDAASSHTHSGKRRQTESTIERVSKKARREETLFQEIQSFEKPVQHVSSENTQVLPVATLAANSLVQPLAINAVSQHHPLENLLLQFVHHAINKTEVNLTILQQDNDAHIVQVTQPIVERLSRMKELPAIEVVDTKLKNYQKEAVSTLLNWYHHKVGGILASEPGLGKTRQAIEYLWQILQSDLEGKPVMAAVPISILGQWNKELVTRLTKGKLASFKKLISQADSLSVNDCKSLGQALMAFLASHYTAKESSPLGSSKMNKLIDKTLELVKEAMKNPNLAYFMLHALDSATIGSVLPLFFADHAQIDTEKMNRALEELKLKSFTLKKAELRNKEKDSVVKTFSTLMEQNRGFLAPQEQLLKCLTKYLNLSQPTSQETCDKPINFRLLRENSYEQVLCYTSDSAKKISNTAFKKNSSQIILTTPHAICNKMVDNSAITQLPFASFILDEAHQWGAELGSVKELGANKKRLQSFIKAIQENAGTQVVLLTGTPLVNSYDETLYHLQLANPQLPFNKLEKELETRKATFMKHIKVATPENTGAIIAALNNLIVGYEYAKALHKSLIIVHKKEDPRIRNDWKIELAPGENVVNLPTKKELPPVELSLTPQQQECLQEASKKRTLFTMQHAIARATFHPRFCKEWEHKDLVDIEKEVQQFTDEELNKFISESSLFTALFGSNSILQQHLSEHMLFFVPQVNFAGLLKRVFEKKFPNVQVGCFTGQLKEHERAHLVQRFKNPKDSLQILVLTPEAGGVGLNLQEATHVFNLAPWWNPADKKQMEARAIRANNRREVYLHSFDFKTTLEVIMRKTSESKELAAQALFEYDSLPIETYINGLVSESIHLSCSNSEALLNEYLDLHTKMENLLIPAKDVLHETVSQRLQRMLPESNGVKWSKQESQE